MAERADDIQRMKVEELKRFLTDRGIPSGGKRKQELIELVLKARDKYNVIEPCDHDESERNRRRVVKDDGSLIDLNGKQVLWTSNLRTLPKLVLRDVFVYLVNSCNWTAERLSQYASDDGYLMFKDNHIENLQVGKIENHNEYVYVKASVKPEQRQGAQRYNTWLLQSSDASIVSAGCACVAA